MLKSFSVQGYRSFLEPAEIELRPITLLLGRNSSGKSSLTRFLPLLQQSLNRRTASPILWTSDVIDFGEIRDVINHDSKTESLTIGLTVDAQEYYEYQVANSPFYYIVPEGLSQLDKFEFKATLAEIDGRTAYKSLSIKCEDAEVTFIFGDSTVKCVLLNRKIVEDYHNSEVIHAALNSLFPSISLKVGANKVSPSGEELYPLFVGTLQLYPGLRSAYEYFVNKSTSPKRRTAALRDLMFAPHSHIADYISKQQNIVKSKLKDEAALRQLSDALFIASAPKILSFIQTRLQQTLQNASYLGPSRASGSRFYRYQELSVDQIDSRGENLPMYLSSLSSTDMANFNNLMEAACGNILSIKRTAGHASIEIGKRNSRYFENLADVGFGFSQFIPIIAQIHAASSGRRPDGARRTTSDRLPRFLAIEQPELHLHPALQTNLADLFATAVRPTLTAPAQLRFLIETHSEALIGRLGELVATDALNPKDVIVYFVDKEDRSRNSAVRVGGFDDDGNLSGWPLGFFSGPAF